MPVFTATLAQTVRVYGAVRFDAPTMADAIRLIHAHIDREQSSSIGPLSADCQNPWDVVTEIEWGTASEETIVEIADHPARDGIHHDITLTFDDPDTGVMVMSTDDVERIIAENRIPGAKRQV